MQLIVDILTGMMIVATVVCAFAIVYYKGKVKACDEILRDLRELDINKTHTNIDTLKTMLKYR